MGSGSEPKPYWLDIVICDLIQYTKPKAEQGIYELNSGGRNFMSLGPIPLAERVETISDLKKVRPAADSEKRISTPKNSFLQVPLLNCSLSPLSTRLNASKNATVASAVSFREDVTSIQEVSVSDSHSDADVTSCSINDSVDTKKTVVAAVIRIAARKKLDFPAKEMSYSKWQLHEIQRSIRHFMNDGDSEDKGSLKKWIFEFFGDVKPRGQSNTSNSKIIFKKQPLNERKGDLASQSVRDMSAVASLLKKVAIVNPADASEISDGVPSLDLNVEDSPSRNKNDADNQKENEKTSLHSDNSNNTSSSSCCETGETASTHVSDAHGIKKYFLRRSNKVEFQNSRPQKFAPEKPKFDKKAAKQTFPASKKKPVTSKAKLNSHSCSYPSCNFKTRGLYVLKQHLGKVHFETPFKCSKCGLKYRLFGSLANHSKTHEEKNQICLFKNCNYKSVYSSSLKTHMMMHRGEKPIACKECEYKTSKSSHLKQHMRVHTGEKPFACKECEYKSSQNTNLKEHMKIHTGEKPFACKECEYKGSRNTNLKEHMKIHTGEKPFKCKECEFKFSRKEHLKKHVNRRHGVKT